MIEPGEVVWMIHGVVRAGTPVPPDAPPHVQVPFGGLAALLSSGHVIDSRAPSGPGEPCPVALQAEAVAALEHNRLLTAYALAGDVAPVRYGAAVGDPAAAPALLAPQAARYGRILDRVAGAVEYALRLSPAQGGAPVQAPAVPDVPSGRAYLRAQRSRRDARDTQAADRAAFLAGLAEDMADLCREMEVLPARADRVLDLALLVPRENVAHLVARAEDWHGAAGARGLVLALIGPWPPHSFTQGAVDEPAQGGGS